MARPSPAYPIKHLWPTVSGHHLIVLFGHRSVTWNTWMEIVYLQIRSCPADVYFWVAYVRSTNPSSLSLTPPQSVILPRHEIRLYANLMRFNGAILACGPQRNLLFITCPLICSDCYLWSEMLIKRRSRSHVQRQLHRPRDLIWVYELINYNKLQWQLTQSMSCRRSELLLYPVEQNSKAKLSQEFVREMRIEMTHYYLLIDVCKSEQYCWIFPQYIVVYKSCLANKTPYIQRPAE